MKRLIVIARYYDLEPLELVLALAHIGFGVILLLNGSILHAYSGYRLLTFLPESIWAVWALGCGSLKLVMLAIERYSWWRFLAVAAFAFWVTWTICIALAGPISPGAWLYFCLTLASALCDIRRDQGY